MTSLDVSINFLAMPDPDDLDDQQFGEGVARAAVVGLELLPREAGALRGREGVLRIAAMALSCWWICHER